MISSGLFILLGVAHEACGPAVILAIAIVLALFFAVLNMLGVKKAVVLQNILVLTLILVLCIFIFKGLPQVKVQHLSPFAPHGFGAFFTTEGMMFVSFGGLLKVASMALLISMGGAAVMGCLSLPGVRRISVVCAILFCSAGACESHYDPSTTHINI